MIPWKHRTYAFLLRRVLGPFLTEESLKQLHASLDVSLLDGTCTLTDIQPCIESLNKRIENLPVALKTASIKTLTVQLSLQDTETEEQSSLAWRALQLGSAESKIALIVHLEIEGLSLELIPSIPIRKQTETDTTAEEPSESSSGEVRSTLSTYMDAALKALELSVNLKDVSIRLWDGECQRWCETRLQSLCYETVPSPNAPAKANYQTTLHKTVQWKGVTLTTGHTLDNDRQSVARVEGVSRVTFRIVEYSNDKESAEQDLEISIPGKCQLCVGARAAAVLGAVASDIRSATEEAIIETIDEPSVPDKPTEDDEEAMETLTSIMKQYHEARKQVERQEVRGGIMVPSDSILQDGTPDDTFDLFFDANEKSFYHYSTVLRESMMIGDGSRRKGPRSKIRFHAGEASFKLMLETDSTHLEGCDDYILLLGTDLNVVSEITPMRQDVTFTTSRLQLDDSISTCCSSGPSIGTVMSFVTSPDLLVPSPALALLIERSFDTDRSITSIEIDVEPIEILLRPPTFAGVASTLSDMSALSWNQESEADSSSEVEPEDNKGKDQTLFRFACPSFELRIPVEDEVDLSPLFRNCTHTEASPLRSSALGMHVYDVSTSIDVIVSEKHDITISLDRVVTFVEQPCETDVGNVNIFDFFALSGRTEIEPHIPICIKIHNKTIPENATVHDMAVASAFPLSSPIFKAQQDDDDDHLQKKSLASVSGSEYAKRIAKSNHLQTDMLQRASQSDTIVTCYIPDIVCDLCVAEIITLVLLFRSFDIAHKKESQSAEETNSNATDGMKLSCCFSVDMCLFTLHDNPDHALNCVSDSFSARLTSIKVHTCSGGKEMKQSRFLVGDCHLVHIDDCSRNGATSPESSALRVLAIRQRFSGGRVDNMLYRSQLFEPISTLSPNIVVDLTTPMKPTFMRDRSMHVTLYDLTVRVLYETMDKCKLKLFSMLEQLKIAGVSKNDEGFENDVSVLKLFIVLSDCNIDYTSPRRFQTPSRSILRWGNVRLSSNVVSPSAQKQAFAVSVHDFSFNVCNHRHPYTFEDSLLQQLPHSRQAIKRVHSSESARTSMNYKTVLTFDAFEANVVHASSDRVDEDEPQDKICLQIGTVSLLACKDAFRVFVSTLSDISTEIASVSPEKLDSLSALKPKSGMYPEKIPETALSQSEELRDDETFSEACVTRLMPTDKKYLLDGYDWTTINADESDKPSVPDGKEQSARWFSDGDEEGLYAADPPRIVANHHPKIVAGQRLQAGDMNAFQYVDENVVVAVKTRIVVHRLALRLRLFDGYDWPEQLGGYSRSVPRGCAFLIEHSGELETNKPRQKDDARTSTLLNGLLYGGSQSDTFRDIPLPEEKSRMMKEKNALRHWSRRSSRYMEVSVSGLEARIDSIKESDVHRLISCIDVSAKDFFVAETIGSVHPVKMVGEWVSDLEHPRDTKDGLFSTKMVTWQAESRVTQQGTMSNDEAEFALKLLPLRCRLDQKAIRFAKLFFASQDSDDEEASTFPEGYQTVPPVKFRSFRVFSFQLKVDYLPEKMDTKALRDGALVELVNLSPIEGMVLTLQPVEVTYEIGFGAVVSILSGSWVKDVCSTQLMKFLTNSRPLEPITHVGGGLMDLVVLPWEAVSNGDNLRRALRAGTTSFTSALVYETLTLTSRVAGFLADAVSRGATTNDDVSRILPNRPFRTPRTVTEASPHALESLTRGLQTASYKIVVVPYREYKHRGATGAAKSVLKGIPIAIAAPTSGAAEALSFALLGARNQIHPQVRKEEEANQRGLLPDDR